LIKLAENREKILKRGEELLIPFQIQLGISNSYQWQGERKLASDSML
jgi:hypothetical protein